MYPLVLHWTALCIFLCLWASLLSQKSLQCSRGMRSFDGCTHLSVCVCACVCVSLSVSLTPCRAFCRRSSVDVHTGPWFSLTSSSTGTRHGCSSTKLHQDRKPGVGTHKSVGSKWRRGKILMGRGGGTFWFPKSFKCQSAVFPHGNQPRNRRLF